MEKILFKIIALTLFSILSLPSWSQKSVSESLDSMLKVLPNCKEDTNKVHLLNSISFACRANEYEQGIKYGKQALQLAEKMKFNDGIAEAWNSLGANYMNNSENEQAMSCYRQAFLMNEKLDNKYRMAQNLGNIGLVYDQQSKFPEALEYLFKALKIFEVLKSKSGMAIQFGNIGNIYQEDGNPKKAFYYDSLALELHQELGDKEGQGIELGNMGNIMSDLGNVKQSMYYDKLAIEIFRKANNSEGLARNLNNLGVSFEALKMYDSSLYYQNLALENYKKAGSKMGCVLALGNMGEIYLKLADKNVNLPSGFSSHQVCLQKAIDNLSQAVEAGKGLDELSTMLYYYNVYSDALERKGAYKEALENYKKFHALSDSVFNTESKVKVENLTTEREVALKNKQIEIDRLAVEKKKDRELALYTGLAILLMMLLMAVRNFQKQKKLNTALRGEKKKSDDLLLNILPSEVADELKETGVTEAKHFDEVTVMFTDFVEFTKIGETLSPQVLVKELHDCFSAFDAIIEKNGLEKIKTVGDAYIAVCGLPTANDKHAIHCVKAALEIIQFMETRKKEQKVFEIRIGIHTGPVVAGIVGVKKFAYDIWGDTVNTASRMESSGEAGKINISESTYSLVKEKFSCTHRGKISAKGKGEIDMYFVNASQDIKKETL